MTTNKDVQHKAVSNSKRSEVIQMPLRSGHTKEYCAAIQKLYGHLSIHSEIFIKHILYFRNYIQAGNIARNQID